MAKKTKAASFEDFLETPTRLAERKPAKAARSSKDAREQTPHGSSAFEAKGSKASRHKVKVGLTIDSDIIDAVDDYIYHERKQGNRLKKNDVYEAALRQFLGLKEGDVR